MKVSAFLRSNPLSRFIFWFLVLYGFLYAIHEWIIKEFTYWDNRFIAHVIRTSEFLLNAMGYRTFKTISDTGMQAIGIDGSNGVWVGSPCSAIALFNLFVSFIIPFPGRQKHKWWFVILGVLLIHIINVLRVTALCIIAYHAPLRVDFNHTYTFTFIVYVLIFLLWMLWVKKFSGIESESDS